MVLRIPHRIQGVGHTIAGGEILDIDLPKGKTLLAPPVKDDEFISWAKDQKMTAEKWVSRLGWPLSKVQSQILIPIRPAQTRIETPAVSSEALKVLDFLKEARWKAHVTTDNIQAAHILVKNGLAFHVKENHFLHSDWNQELLKWLNRFFQNKEFLGISEARDFFMTGRKDFMAILEYCDRHQWLFRFKGEGDRKKFKLPSLTDSSVCPPKGENANDRRTDRPPDSCL